MDASGYDHAAFIPEFYDHIVPYATRADVRFYVEAARECGGPVLELGCGTGRILVPTARAGVEIAGLDASEGMLDARRRRLRAEPPEVQGRVSLHRGDLRDFDLARAFRLVTIPFRPFQHLITVAEQLACLGAIRRHLTTDGRLVFDVFNPSIHNLAKPADGAETDEEPSFTLPDGRTVIRRHRMLERDLVRQSTPANSSTTSPTPMTARSASSIPSRCVASSVSRRSTCSPELASSWTTFILTSTGHPTGRGTRGI